LLVFGFSCRLKAGTGDQPPWRLAIPGFTGRERAMVLISLIIIAVALLVLGVSGIRCKLPVPMPAAGPDLGAPG
jgi:hypothetical protein